MTAIEIVGLLKDYGAFGFLALALYVIAKMDGRNTVLQEKVITVAEASKTAAEHAASSLKELERTVDSAVGALQTLGREQEVEFQGLRHTVGNTDMTVKSISDRLPRYSAKAPE